MARVLVAGALANRPGNAGGAWVRLSFVRGLRRLGHEVRFVEQIAPANLRGPDGKPAPPESSANLAYFRRVSGEFGLDDCSALIGDDGGSLCGLPVDAIAEFAGASDLLVNLSGHLTLDALFRGPRVRAYVDLDPGYTQIWHEQGIKAVDEHNVYFTIGENVGCTGCPVPTLGLRWRPLRQPVVLTDWPVADTGAPDRLTTIAHWRAAYGPLQHDGRHMGGKLHEFRRFWSLPAEIPQTAEIALDIDPGDDADRDELRRRGWALVDPREVAAEPADFRRYVMGSGGELSPAQGVYVDTRCGWFSDRTTRYLAAGRPALVQDTGLRWARPGGEGLVTFGNVAEAIAGAQAIAHDYEGHRRAARAIAEERLDSDRVLSALLHEAGI